MAEYLLDSDVLIWCLRGRQDTVSFVQSLALEAQPCCSTLSILEVELGIKPGEEKATLEFLDSLRGISVNRSIARQAAALIRFYRVKGRKMDFVDAVIGATCIQEDLVLATYNLKHYPMPELKKMAPV